MVTSCWSWTALVMVISMTTSTILVTLGGAHGVITKGKLEYCSFFNNRAPTAQPGLSNCTWFKQNSCCLQQEIEATFVRVKPLKGASLDCQRHINALMCYICAPNQNVFYQNERLTVCEEFCDQLYAGCKNAILKGSVIGDLYESGAEFCQSRRFLVSKKQCFIFDVTSLYISGAGTSVYAPLVVNASFLIRSLLFIILQLLVAGDVVR